MARFKKEHTANEVVCRSGSKIRPFWTKIKRL